MKSASALTGLLTIKVLDQSRPDSLEGTKTFNPQQYKYTYHSKVGQFFFMCLSQMIMSNMHADTMTTYQSF